MEQQEQMEPATPPRKPWTAPQLVVVDIAKRTELSGSPGSDGAATPSCAS
jgi:hypothetical protein